MHHRFIDNGSDNTVMLLHGFMADSRSMADIGSKLGERFNILYIDLPGFGRTKSTVAGYDMEMLADSLKMILDELGLEKIDILGYSMGGRVALAFSILHPQHVRSLILESASAGLKTVSERAHRAAVDEERAGKITSDYRTFLDEWEDMGLFQTQKSLSEEASRRQRKMRESQYLVIIGVLAVIMTSMRPLAGLLTLILIIVTILMLFDTDKSDVEAVTETEKKMLIIAALTALMLGFLI